MALLSGQEMSMAGVADDVSDAVTRNEYEDVSVKRESKKSAKEGFDSKEM